MVRALLQLRLHLLLLLLRGCLLIRAGWACMRGALGSHYFLLSWRLAWRRALRPWLNDRTRQLLGRWRLQEKIHH